MANAPTASPAPLPFHAAAREHTEAFFNQALVSGTAEQPFLQGAAQGVPAEGFLRSVFFTVIATGGVAGTFAGDAPWNALDNVYFTDVNGAYLFYPMDGYSVYLINKYGGYQFRGDPAIDPDYVGTTPNFAYALRLPVEINRQTGFGALANQNAAASYKMGVSLNTTAAIWSVAPTTVPTVTINGTIETWTQPLPYDGQGRPQATTPPMLGVTQKWSKQSYTINAGVNNITLARVGNLIRSLILIYRDNTGARVTQASGHMPPTIEFDWDNIQYKLDPVWLRRQAMVKEYGAGVNNSAEDGVLVYNWDRTIIGHVGGGTAALYLPTEQSSRLQISGNFGVAGTLTVLTNDITPAAVTNRYATPSATGFQPQVGQPTPGFGG